MPAIPQVINLLHKRRLSTSLCSRCAKTDTFKIKHIALCSKVSLLFPTFTYKENVSIGYTRLQQRIKEHETERLCARVRSACLYACITITAQESDNTKPKDIHESVATFFWYLTTLKRGFPCPLEVSECSSYCFHNTP
jgi:hypothetical protein